MSEGASEYDGWAWLYDRTMGPAYGAEQFAVLERVLLPRLKPGAELLDLCCGTGQLIAPLVAAGYKVTGLDSSEEMLARAKENAPQATFVLEDARKFEGKERFDAAFSTSASLNHIPTIGDLGEIFASICAALREGGVFVFDLNHPGQLTKWWRGRPLEGEISEEWAWMVTPRYDAEAREGAFRVTMFTRPEREGVLGKVLRPLKSGLYRLLAKERFIGLRIKLIQRFSMFEPGWAKREIDFPIVGHDLEEVRRGLKEAGFAKIEIQKIDGESVVDDEHSAYFVCTKSADES